ncbi:MAG: ATP-binding cassette domain-containing protein [Steroidobacteraceae bacterium]|nr:ATP-binding cassette domain-containing protein [Deltaproteobacteria bacterium]
MKPVSSNEPAICVEGLDAGYADKVIFDRLSFQVERGELFVILGGSGCGKSTLLRLLIGLKSPSAGRILINGVDITTADEMAMNGVRTGIGVLFQSGALFGSMTLAENVALPLKEYTNLSPDAIERVVAMKLAMVSLAGHENHYPSELSGGMVKRAGLARAMALDPSILFFDEPSAGLDPITAAELDQLIKDLNRGLGTTVVVVTHDLESIMTIADRVIMLDGKKKGIIAEGDPRELKMHSQDPLVQSFFNREPLKTVL